MNRFSAVALGSLLLLSVCGSGPPPEGTEVQGGPAVGRYRRRDACSATVYHHDSLDAHLKATHRAQNGLTVAAETTGAWDEIAIVDPPRPPGEDGDRQGDRHLLGVAALRGGWHARFGGIEAGPAVLAGTKVRGVGILPSAEVWLGKPDTLFAWGTFFSGPVSTRPLFPAGAGLGVSRERIDLRAGLTYQGFEAEALAPVSGGGDWRIGGDVLFAGPDAGWRGQLKLAWAPRRRAARAPAAAPAPAEREVHDPAPAETPAPETTPDR